MNNFDNVELSLSFPAAKSPSSSTRYTKCMKNHAAAMGGNAVDGCGEFVASGPEGLTCGACDCHRNFHTRVESVPKQRHQISPQLFQFYPYEKTEQLETEHRKRYRTKFTVEQKEKMIEFAEMIGWRLHKRDEAAVERFCSESGVSRRVFKVWMHNNKNILAKRSPS